MNQQKVLVAGAASFLGSHLAESLIHSGLKVVGIDTFVLGRKENIDHLLGNPLFDFLEIDINQRLPESLQHEEWLAVVHAASTETFEPGSRIDLNELLNNSFGVKNLLDLSLRTKSRFVLTSTIDLYAGLASHTSLFSYYEDAAQAGVLSYTEAKRYAEALCQEYAVIYGLDVRIARLSETYGPRMNLESESIVSRLITAALEGEHITLEEVGSRMIYVTYVSDIVFGLHKLVVRDEASLKGGIFYFVNKEPVSVLSIALTVKEHAVKEMSVEFLPHVEKSLFELPSTDLTRSKNELYWDSKISLQEGIKRTLEYFAEHPNISSKKKEQPLHTLVPHLDDEPLEISEEAQSIPTGDSVSQQQVEAEILSDAIKETQENVTLPALPQSEQPTLKSSHGWLSLKDSLQQKAAKLPLKGIAQKEKKRNWVKELFLSIGAIAVLWFFVIPLIGFGGHASAAHYHYTKASQALEDFRLSEVRSRYGKVESHLGDSSYYLQRSSWIFTLTGQKEWFSTVQQLMQGLTEGAKAIQWGAQFVEDTQPWWNSLVYSEDTIAHEAMRTPEQIAKAQASWRLFSQYIGVSSEILEPVTSPVPVPLFQDKITSAISMINEVSVAAQIDDGAWENLSMWFGYEVPQELIILFQNNHELRAGGGFIGSYARMKINQGEIESFLVDDIYNPDGQLDQLLLPEESPAPDVMKQFLGVNHLYLRDSNWWPHFPDTGENFVTLYSKATSITPQWVIGINLSLVEGLLSLVGELELPATHSTVTAETLFEKAEVASEVGFVPGSTGKKDFLTEVAQQLWLKLFPVQKENLASLGAIIGRQLADGNVQFYSSVPEWQQIVEQAAIAGEIGTTQGDYISVISSNVGGNKSNYWIERSTDYSIYVDREGNLRSKTDIYFTHRGTTETWPGGLYKDYVRVYVPLGSILAETSGFIGDITTYEEYGKTVFAGLVEVPIQTTKQVTLMYHLPDSLSLTQGGTYTLLVENQSGLQETFSVNIGLPFFLEFEEASPEAIVTVDQQIQWEKLVVYKEQFSLKTHKK